MITIFRLFFLVGTIFQTEANQFDDAMHYIFTLAADTNWKKSTWVRDFNRNYERIDHSGVSDPDEYMVLWMAVCQNVRTNFDQFDHNSPVGSRLMVSNNVPWDMTEIHNINWAIQHPQSDKSTFTYHVVHNLYSLKRACMALGAWPDEAAQSSISHSGIGFQNNVEPIDNALDYVFQLASYSCKEKATWVEEFNTACANIGRSDVTIRNNYGVWWMVVCDNARKNIGDFDPNSLVGNRLKIIHNINDKDRGFVNMAIKKSNRDKSSSTSTRGDVAIHLFALERACDALGAWPTEATMMDVATAMAQLSAHHTLIIFRNNAEPADNALDYILQLADYSYWNQATWIYEFNTVCTIIGRTDVTIREKYNIQWRYVCENVRTNIRNFDPTSLVGKRLMIVHNIPINKISAMNTAIKSARPNKRNTQTKVGDAVVHLFALQRACDALGM